MRSSTRMSSMSHSAPTVPKYPRTHRIASPPPVVAPSHSTRSDGASSSSAQGSGMLKMFQGIFAMCPHSDQRLDVIEQRMKIVRRNQEIIHSQRDEPFQEFPNVPVFPPVPDTYVLLTPAELTAFGIVPSHAPAWYDDDDEEEEAGNDDEKTENDE
jgi:hypothetical protein